MGNEGVHTGVLKPHGVEDAHGGLGDPGGWVTLSGQRGETFDTDGPQLAQIEKLAVLPAEAEGAGGDYNGVFEDHSGQIYPQVSHSSPPPWR